MVDQQSKQETWQKQDVILESIMLPVICSPHNLMVPHVPHNGEGGSKEDEFHGHIVEGECNCSMLHMKEIKIACCKYNGIKLLCLQ